MREFHEVRKDLSGDEAAPYIGVARTLLGQMKNQMQLGGLMQGRRSVTLPDGAVITVESRFGQDTVRIVPSTAGASAAAGQPQPTNEPSSTTPEPFTTAIPWVPSHVAVGGAWNNTIGQTGIYWPTEKDAPIDIGASFGNSDIGQYLTSVTADGHTAVGWWGNDGVIYTRSGGVHDIPVPNVDNSPSGSGNSTAASISYDGGTVGIAAVPVGGAFSIGYVWRPKASAFQSLPQVSVPTEVASETVIVSGNGKVAAGRGPHGGVEAAVAVDVASGAILRAIDGAKIMAMDYAGTVLGGCTNYGQSNQTAVLWTPQGAISLGLGQVEGVSADGTVACGTLGLNWYDTRGFIWTKAKGIMMLPSQSAAHCVAPCGTAIGGALNADPVVWDSHGKPTTLALPAGSYIYAPVYGGVFGLAQRAPLAMLGQGDTPVSYPS